MFVLRITRKGFLKIHFSTIETKGQTVFDTLYVYFTDSDVSIKHLSNNSGVYTYVAHN